MKKRLVALGCAMMLTVGCLAGCGKTEEKVTGWTTVQDYTYEDIASWPSMQTPTEGSGSGSVIETNETDGYVTIQAAADGWGGVESDYFEIDLSKDPIVLARIFENPDGCTWGMKVVPEDPMEDHEWGVYVIPDNNLKWNTYAGVKLKDALGQDFIDIYGEQCNIKLWIYPAGGPEATVSVSEILIMNTK